MCYPTAMTTAYWKDFWGSTWRRTNPYGTPGPRSLYTKGYHRGEDIANAGSTADVPALHAGEIIDSGRSGVIGHWLCVKPDAYPDKRDIYCHMYEPTSVESGHVEAGDILGRTAGWGENPGSGWNGPHLHFVVSNLSDGGYNTDREDFDPNPFIDAALAADDPLAPNQRRSQGSKARRSASSQSEKVDDGYLDPGTTWYFKGFVRGESVEGNNIWFVGQNSGLYYWSGTFDGGADTTGLAEIGAPSVGPKQRIVTGDGVYGRKGPGTSYEYQREEASGVTLSFQGWVEGETVNLNGFTTNVWYFDGSLYYSAACFTSQSTDGLTKLTGPTPTEPEVPEWKNRIPDSSLAKWIGSPNFNYRTPRPAGTKPTHVTEHWMDGTLAGTDAHFQTGNGEGSASTYGVGQTEIHQYVREGDYQQADGSTFSNRSGISIEHEASATAPATAAVQALSVRLHVDIARRHGFVEYVIGDPTMSEDEITAWAKANPTKLLAFPHKKWVATTCPGTLPYIAIVDAANKALLKKEEPPIVPPVEDETVSVSKSWLTAVFEKLKGLLGK